STRPSPQRTPIGRAARSRTISTASLASYSCSRRAIRISSIPSDGVRRGGGNVAHALNARLPPIIGRQFEQLDIEAALERHQKIHGWRRVLRTAPAELKGVVGLLRFRIELSFLKMRPTVHRTKYPRHLVQRGPGNIGSYDQARAMFARNHHIDPLEKP